VAATLAALSAGVSLYWAVGGQALLDTVGGTVADLGRRGGPQAHALGLAAAAAKLAGVGLAVLLVRPVRPALVVRLVRLAAGLGSVVLTLYGGLLVFVGGLVLAGVIVPRGPVDRHALRWHVFLWDLWFLAWGLALGLALWLVRRGPRPVP